MFWFWCLCVGLTAERMLTGTRRRVPSQANAGQSVCCHGAADGRAHSGTEPSPPLQASAVLVDRVTHCRGSTNALCYVHYSGFSFLLVRFEGVSPTDLYENDLRFPAFLFV